VQINVVLKSMADAAQGTQRAVDAAQHETEQLRNRSTSAQAALSDISSMTGTLSNSVTEVIDGTKSMKAQSGEVGHTMDSIMHYTAENSAASEQTAVAVQGVNTQAQAVQRLIADFRNEPA
jgi:methyl-accepting chemotaxis protein